MKSYKYYPEKVKDNSYFRLICCARCNKPGLFKWWSNDGMYSFARWCRDCAEEVGQNEKIYSVGFDIDKFLNSMRPKDETRFL